MLDEALAILVAAWSGEPVNHRGKHYLINDVQFLPRPVQRPRILVWAAAFPGNLKPLRRAARYDGFFPVNLEDVDEFAQAVARCDSTRPGGMCMPFPEQGAQFPATWIYVELLDRRIAQSLGLEVITIRAD